jgi:hypothetical protein
LHGADEQDFRQARRDLLASALLLALVFAAVLCGLAYEENWRKLLRIGLASSVYLSALLLLTYRWRKGPAPMLPFWPFALAAAAAELSSGWLRTRVADGMTFWLAPAAAVFVGGLHWLALRHWRRLRARLTGFSSSVNGKELNTETQRHRDTAR